MLTELIQCFLILTVCHSDQLQQRGPKSALHPSSFHNRDVCKHCKQNQSASRLETNTTASSGIHSSHAVNKASSLCCECTTTTGQCGNENHGAEQQAELRPADRWREAFRVSAADCQSRLHSDRLLTQLNLSKLPWRQLRFN